MSLKDYTWSYNREKVSDSVKAEYILKYGDIPDIKEVISIFGLDYCREIWIKEIISDRRFNQLNYFLARFIFNISEDRQEILKFLKQHSRKRFERV